MTSLRAIGYASSANAQGATSPTRANAAASWTAGAYPPDGAPLAVHTTIMLDVGHPPSCTMRSLPHDERATERAHHQGWTWDRLRKTAAALLATGSTERGAR